MHGWGIYLSGLLFGAILALLLIMGVSPTSLEVKLESDAVGIVTIVLTAVAVLVTTLGVFVAILAIWGFSQLRQSAQSAATAHVEAELKDGPLRQEIDRSIEQRLNGMLYDDQFVRLLEDRVDEILLSHPEKRSSGRHRKGNVNEEEEYGE